jgi:hypothetical protein
MSTELDRLVSRELEEETYTGYTSSIAGGSQVIITFTAMKDGAIVGIATNNNNAYTWDILIEGKTALPGRIMYSKASRSNMDEMPFYIPVSAKKKVEFVVTGSGEAEARLRVIYFGGGK